jgi:hypothetical protein
MVGAKDRRDRAAVDHAYAPPVIGERIRVYRIKDPVTSVGTGYCKKPGAWVGCGQLILWCETAKHKRIPVNPTPDQHGFYTAHWATCSYSRFFRDRS